MPKLDYSPLDRIYPKMGDEGRIPRGKLLFYDYDPRTGVLQVSIRSGDLEKLLARIGPIPEEGIDVTLPRPPLNPSPVAFKGVKQIIPFPGLKEGEYLWSPKFD